LRSGIGHNQASLANDQIIMMKLKSDERITLPKWKGVFRNGVI